MASVLVTGARGFIGGHLADALAARGHDAVGLDDGSNATPHEPHRSIRAVAADVRDPSAIAQAVALARPETIFHLAAIAGVRPSLLRPGEYASRNVVGTVNVIA